MPLLPALSAIGFATADARAFDAVAILASAEEADLAAAIDGSLALCERQVDGEWRPARDGAETLPLRDTLDIVVIVVAHNLGPYFLVERPNFRVTITGTGGFDPVMMPDDKDWLYRPMMRGLCRYESLIDGTLHIEDLAEMNAVLDAADENQRRIARAAEKNAR